jgi:hypothetical protein
VTIQLCQARVIRIGYDSQQYSQFATLDETPETLCPHKVFQLGLQLFISSGFEQGMFGICRNGGQGTNKGEEQYYNLFDHDSHATLASVEVCDRLKFVPPTAIEPGQPPVDERDHTWTAGFRP